jgi:ketosteroid isomerase-like protein
MSSVRCVSIAFLAFTTLACSSAPEPTGPSAEEDLAAIAAVRAELQAALANDDIPGIMAKLDVNHLTMAPDGPTPPDNEALSAFHQARVDQFSFLGEFTTDDIQLFGDIAIERFSGDLRLVPREDGEDVVDSTTGVWIWKRQEGGGWKLLWSIWNSDLLLEERCEVFEGA